MSELQKLLMKNMPIILRKTSVSHKTSATDEFVVPFKSNTKIHLEETIYKDEEDDPLNGEYPNLIIVNKYLNNLFNSTRTVATYTLDNKTIQLDSDEVTKVVGNENYDVILKALYGIDEMKVKIQAILALLTDGKRHSTAEKCCQTIVSDMETFIRDKSRKKRPSRCKAYVIDDKEALNYPQTIAKKPKVVQKAPVRKNSSDNLLDLKLIVDEDSNISDASVGNLSMISCQIPHILENPTFILQNIDKYTQESIKSEHQSVLKLVDGSTVVLQEKPEDFFHIATANTLRGLSVEDKKRVLLHQAYIDWKYCLQPDQEGNLPLHIAVINNDVELLKRHCALLKSRNASIDVIGGASMTPLQLSIFKNAPACTSLLLQYGADVLLQDDQARTLLHLAADTSVQCVQVILDYCKGNARKILQDEEELWRPDLEEKSDLELAAYLLNKMGEMCNDAGYTPLMIASMKGDQTIVATLLQAAPHSINVQMPTCGNTALYIAVRTAFTEAELSGNRNKIAPNYLEIIETLHKYGADPLITNDSGNSVATLTADFKINDLSQAIANKLLTGTNVKKSFEDYILVKDQQGEINVESLSVKKRKKNGGEKSKSEAKDEKNKTSSKKVIFFNVPGKGKRKKSGKNVQNSNVSESEKKIVEKNEDNREKTLIEKNMPVIITKSNVFPVKITTTNSINSKSTDNVITNKNVDNNPLKINILDTKSLSGLKVVDNKSISTKTPVIIKKSNQIIQILNDNITALNKINADLKKTIKISPSDVLKLKNGGPSDTSIPRFIKIIAPTNKKITVSKEINSIPSISTSIISTNVIKSGAKIITDNIKIIDKKQNNDTDNVANENASIITHNNLKRSADNNINLQLKKKREIS